MISSFILGLSVLAGAVVGQLTFVPGSAPQNKKEPVQHRVAYAGPTGMAISWSTYEPLTNPTVLYGTDVWNLTRSDPGESTTFNSSLTWSNHVKLTGLEPDTKYYYVVENSNCENCTEVSPYTFTTARPAGDYTPYVAALVIDMGVMGPLGESVSSDYPYFKAEDHTTIQSLLRYSDSYDLLLHPGDLAYADTWLPEAISGYLDVPNITIETAQETYNHLLNAYYDEMQPISSKKPYMVGPGNHESNCDEGGSTDPKTGFRYNISLCVEGQRNFTGYIDHWRMPSTESKGVGNFWYSFDHGMVHYVFINTETDLGNGLIAEDDVDGSEGMFSGPFGSYENEQVDWLEKDLASVDRTKTPWIIVNGHRPWYAASKNVSNTICWNCKKAFEPILLKYNVDMVFYGHIHYYERNAPIANGVADPNELNNPSSPWYILNGAGGHYHGLTDYVEPFPDYSRFVQNTTFGWSRLTFHNCTHLTHNFIASANGTVLDSATLFKNHSCPATGSGNYSKPNATQVIPAQVTTNSADNLSLSVTFIAILGITTLVLAA
ncbi:Metallo-dependent phosphatase-like protein [Lipomyces japonicus]|uniref:Metallo-dependent phosphatase-like protein n=1 Tax=Lipomyces japonicus TaxID=56871 RepID=UPI0034CD0BEC